MPYSANSRKIKIDGELVRLLLRRRKIKQKHAAKLLGISDSLLVQHLSGHYPVPVLRLKRLLKLLKIEDLSLILPLREAQHG